LKTEGHDSKIIVFVLTGAIVEYFSAVLALVIGGERPLLALHGQMKQTDREQSLSDLRSIPRAVLITTDVAARGIDVPDVDWIVQFDPPQDPNMFIHRVGRTARIGKKGSALLFLRDHEDAYVDYMIRQQVDIAERLLEVPADADAVLHSIRALAKDDEAFHKKAILAMVSYARAYGEHRLKLLLRKKEVDFVAVGNSFAMVRLPVMPELKDNPAAPEYNSRYAEYAVRYQRTEEQEIAHAKRERERKAEKKKHRTADEDIVLYQRRHRTGAWYKHRK
jgi:ATP-dependent RNA helicase DDX55/SPB4